MRWNFFETLQLSKYTGQKNPKTKEKVLAKIVYVNQHWKVDTLGLTQRKIIPSFKQVLFVELDTSKSHTS